MRRFLILIFSLFLIDWSTIPIENHFSENDYFTIVVLPDTQKYSKKYPHIFDAQTQWIIDNKDGKNIVFVTQLGDIVHNSNSEIQWQRASNAMSKLDDIVPYGISPGNHDMDNREGLATLYNQYFPVSKFQNKPWWGGNYLENKNNYQLFSVGPLKFIILHLEMRPPDDVLAWAGKILDIYSNRMAVISTHNYLSRSGKRQESFYFRKSGNSGEEIWNKLIKNHCNIFMVLCGHCHTESRQVSINDQGNPVFEILQNYQTRKKGGNGWLRYYVFKPSENKIYAYTYSPYLDKFETDKSSQFVFDYDFNKKIK